MKLEYLYKKHAQNVYRYAYYLSGSSSLAEDITSETFIRAWIGIDRIRESTVKAYLMTIARNYYFEILKSNKKFTQDYTQDLYTYDNSEKIDSIKEYQLTMLAIQKLKETERSALLFKVRNDMSYVEIAQTMRITVANAKILVFRARLKLKKNLLEFTGENK